MINHVVDNSTTTAGRPRNLVRCQGVYKVIIHILIMSRYTSSEATIAALQNARSFCRTSSGMILAAGRAYQSKIFVEAQLAAAELVYLDHHLSASVNDRISFNGRIENIITKPLVKASIRSMELPAVLAAATHPSPQQPAILNSQQ